MAAAADWRWRSPALGEPKRLRLPAAEIEVFDRGTGQTLVFAHGWLANANLWRSVVDRLAAGFRCVVLDLPLGAHRLPMPPEADLTPQGCGGLIADVLDALDLSDVTLVGCDSGGAYSQIAVASRPERVAALVLTSCETLFDEFPPAPFTALPAVARNEDDLRALLSALQDPSVRATDAAFGLLVKHPLDGRASDPYALPASSDGGVLHDVAKVMATATTAPLHDAARRLLTDFRAPVLMLWPTEDPVFPLEHARRYATRLHDARVVEIPDSYGFSAEDQPAFVASCIEAFVR